MENWKLVTYTKIPLVFVFSNAARLFVNIVSIRVAEVEVIVVGRLINGNIAYE